MEDQARVVNAATVTRSIRRGCGVSKSPPGLIVAVCACSALATTSMTGRQSAGPREKGLLRLAVPILVRAPQLEGGNEEEEEEVEGLMAKARDEAATGTGVGEGAGEAAAVGVRPFLSLKVAFVSSALNSLNQDIRRDKAGVVGVLCSAIRREMATEPVFAVAGAGGTADGSQGGRGTAGALLPAYLPTMREQRRGLRPRSRKARTSGEVARGKRQGRWCGQVFDRWWRCSDLRRPPMALSREQ